MRHGRHSERFWRWYRTLPIVAMLLACLLTAGMDAAPAPLLRATLFPVRYEEYITASCERHGVDPYLVCAVIKCESNWNPDASSSAGAQGLMQLMPSTSAELVRQGLVEGYDAQNLQDPETNIEFGTAYLAFLQENLSSTDEVIAAYNAGLGSVSSWLSQGDDISQQIRYAETANYLVRVNEAYSYYQRLYPEGIGS